MDSENFTMPVQPMNYGYPMMGGYGYGNGLFGGDWSAILIIFLFAMMGGWGNGFGGGFGGWGLGNEITFPWLLNGQQGINANTDAAINQLSTATTLGTIQTAINTGFSNAEVSACNRALDGLTRSFDSQTAITGGLTNLSSQLAQCCCDNRLATVQTQNVIQTEAAANRAAGTANTQAILDKLCQLELDGVRSDLAAAQRENATLQNQLNMAAFRADNVAQTAALVADNTAQTQALINRIAPYPQPSFLVGNPYGYNGYGNGYGYGCGCGCNANTFFN